VRTIRSLIALTALIAFPLILVVIAVGIVAVGWILVATHLSALVKFAVFAFFAFVVAIWRGAKDALAMRARPARGHELTAAEHPGLWRLVDEVAAAVGTKRPARVVVTPEANAAVTQAAGRRELIIGLPLLATLTMPQLRAVLAHEFGHYGSGHTRLAALTWRARAALYSVSARASGVTGWFVKNYARLYGGLSGAASRDQEWQADEYAAKVAGPLVAAAAMRRVVSTDLAWGALCDNYLPLAGPAQRRAPIVPGLRQLLAANEAHLSVMTDQALDDTARRIWDDTHPPMLERIRAFEAQARQDAQLLPAAGAAPAAAAPSAGDEPASALLTGGDDAFDAIEQTLSGDPDPLADWPELVAVAGARIAADRAGALARSADAAGVADLTVGHLLEALHQGRATPLVESLLNPGLAPQHREAGRRQILTDLMGQAIVASLVAAGRARHTVSWTGPMQLVDTSTGEPVELREQLERAVEDPREVPALRARLTELGVDTAAAIRAVEAPAPIIRGVLSRMRRTDHPVDEDVLVCNTGLLVVPVTAVSAEGLRGMASTREQGRLQRQLEGGIEAIRARPGAWWIDTDDIVSGSFAGLVIGHALTLACTSGQTLVWRTTDRFGAHGPVGEALGQLLGARGTG
jgi:Zn-dependent protease with chaperone function